MKVTRNGITRTIQVSEWGKYSKDGWKKSGCSEPQPSQEGLYVVDDYTIGRLDSTECPTSH
jgi:hypothetical protein